MEDPQVYWPSAVQQPSGSISQVGNYNIIKTIGKGQFGSVKLAVHALTGERVAIKIISKAKLDPKTLNMVSREISIMRMLQHPNIIRLYEVIVSATHIFLVMEYASGGEVMDFIVTHGRLKERDARRFFRQVVAAIDYCHSLRVIHRDLKAENLLLDSQFRIKVIDFGLSNQWRPGELLQTFCGSPTYTAPELIKRQKYEGPEVDVWSLGVLLFVLVCGMLPFDGNSFQELFSKIVHCEYEMPEHVSPECRDLIGRMLVVDPTQRATLDQVRTHRWVLDDSGQPVPKADPFGVGFAGIQQELDELILDECERIGYDRMMVIRSVLGNLYNDAAATYFLVLSRKMHEEEARQQRKRQELEEEQRAAQQREAASHVAAHSAVLPRAHPPQENRALDIPVHRVKPLQQQQQHQVEVAAPPARPTGGQKREGKASSLRPKKDKSTQFSLASTPSSSTRAKASDEAPAMEPAPAAPAAAVPAHMRHRRHRTVGTTAEITSVINEAEKQQPVHTPVPPPSGSPTILTPRSDSPESLSPRSPAKSPMESPRGANNETPPMSPSREESKKQHRKARRLSETSPQRRPVVIRDAKELSPSPSFNIPPIISEDVEASGESTPTIRVSQPSSRRSSQKRTRGSSREKADSVSATVSFSTNPPSTTDAVTASSSSSSSSVGPVHKRHRSVDNDEPKSRRISKSPRSPKVPKTPVDAVGTTSHKRSPSELSLKPPTPIITPKEALVDDEDNDWVFLTDVKSPPSPAGSEPMSPNVPRHASAPSAAPASSQQQQQQQRESNSLEDSTQPTSTITPPDSAAKAGRHSSIAGGIVPRDKVRAIASPSQGEQKSWLDSLRKKIANILPSGSSKPEPRQIRFPINEQSTSHRSPEEILDQLKTAMAALNLPYTLTSPFCLKCELDHVGIEVEICRLPLLYLNGVRFRRIYGDGRHYINLGQQILSHLNLKDDTKPAN